MEHGMALAMAVVTLAGILAGYRVAFVLAGSAALFILISDTPLAFFNLLLSRIYATALSNWILVAVPMFILLGYILEKTGVAERSLHSSQKAFGGSPIGMIVSVLFVGVLLAASSGIVGASVVLLGLIAMPRLVEAGLDKPTAAGLVASSGTLAILVPPSVMLIILGDQLQVPIGDMFAGAIGPGLLMFCLYGVYAGFRAIGLPGVEGHEAQPIVQTLYDVGPLILLVVCVLGSIINGIATPTEASGLGALGAILIAALYRRFTWKALMDSARDTVRTSAMVFAVLIGAVCFSVVFRRVGGDDLILSGASAFGDGPWTILIVVMGAIFVLGFFLDWLEITLIMLPIFAPVIESLDFGNGLEGTTLIVWFGILVAINLQTSFLTPPFGFALFYLQGVLGKRVTAVEIYRGGRAFRRDPAHHARSRLSISRHHHRAHTQMKTGRRNR